MKRAVKMLFVLMFAVTSCFALAGCGAKEQKELAYNEMTESMKTKVVSYAMTILEDYLRNPSFEYGNKNYTTVRTNDRYKVEGKVNGETFYVILEWDYKTDETFTAVSVQVGDKVYLK